MAQVVLKPRKAQPFYGRHPWVLDSAIARVDGAVDDGDVVELVAPGGDWIARGVYNSRSRIRVRLYTWEHEQPLDEDFWRGRLERALALRRQLGYNDAEGAARLVFSEADGISGLIVDRYGSFLAVQPGAAAIAQNLDMWTELLVELVQPQGIVLRSEKGITSREGFSIDDGLHWGERPPEPVFTTEHGLRYGVELVTGQKTGFYLDQRENRRIAAGYLAGRRVLDLFCYSGGFALAARQLGEAREVVGIDSSARAIQLAEANKELNGVTGVRFERRDAFEAMEALASESKRFGAVVLDPPKFAQSRDAVSRSLRAYHRLNELAVKLLEPDGMLVTCSCSGYVSREDFAFMLSGVSRRCGRPIQILESRGAAPDHPVSVSCLESEYLKCFICRVA